jgi:PAS domain S-box-containing protein
LPARIVIFLPPPPLGACVVPSGAKPPPMRPLSDPASASPLHQSQHAAALREERDRFVGFAFAAADLLLEVSGEGDIIFVAGAAKALTGAEVAQLIGKNFSTLVIARDREVAVLTLKRVRAEGRIDPVALAFANTAGEISYANVSGCLLPDKGDTIYLAVASARGQATTAGLKGKRDAATGLLDGAAFREAASETLLKAKDNGANLELALLRVDGLDDLGSRAGSEKLGRLMSDIGAFLRAHSIGGNGAGRLANDKFGVIRHRASAKTGLGNEIERLSRFYDPQGQGVQAGESAVDLDASGITLDDAAKALAFTLGRFATSRAGEFSIASLAEGFRAQIDVTVNRIARLKAATRKFTVAFQPIVALDSNLLHHYEMLARFEGSKSPSDMIQFAEKIGMIEEIDLAMCQRAIATLLEMEGQPLNLAVNVSGRSLDSDMFVEALTKLFESHKQLSKQILFEITETTAITNLKRADRILATWRKAGYRICLDDFGAGASSFPYLQALSIDFAKIDGLYIARMRDSSKDRAILKAMVVMCRELGIGVIAEMVERVEQARELQEMGIGYGQGYLFGRPSPTLTAFAPALGNADGRKKSVKIGRALDK